MRHDNKRREALSSGGCNGPMTLPWMSITSIINNRCDYTDSAFQKTGFRVPNVYRNPAATPANIGSVNFAPASRELGVKFTAAGLWGVRNRPRVIQRLLGVSRSAVVSGAQRSTPLTTAPIAGDTGSTLIALPYAPSGARVTA